MDFYEYEQATNALLGAVVCVVVVLIATARTAFVCVVVFEHIIEWPTALVAGSTWTIV